ncbi:MAG: hypothetical protein BJ554DRAFT_7813 [Olpidium bornovanus]|uniref:Uncharacterized protein n=1 Tax=Olpidium bornovanus TaxID=278681 RepID=A0A8H7ZVY5_9FUNG|nr:MAG: hypothetical protein BJ554DRAFT_7813 [Olpidium bornovanus]
MAPRGNDTPHPPATPPFSSHDNVALWQILSEIEKFDGNGGPPSLFLCKLDAYFTLTSISAPFQPHLAANKLLKTPEALWYAHVDAGGDPSWAGMNNLLRSHFDHGHQEVEEASRKLRQLRQTTIVKA